MNIEWMDKIWYIDTMEFYLIIKQNLSFARKGTHLDIIKLSKLDQSKNKIYVPLFVDTWFYRHKNQVSI